MEGEGEEGEGGEAVSVTVTHCLRGSVIEYGRTDRALSVTSSSPTRGSPAGWRTWRGGPGWR